MARYESARLERLNPSLQNNNSYAYDLSGSQTWNPNGFANAQSLGGIRSASASLKPNARGRTGLPTVCSLVMLQRAGFKEKFSVAVSSLSLHPPSLGMFLFTSGFFFYLSQKNVFQLKLIFHSPF